MTIFDDVPSGHLRLCSLLRVRVSTTIVLAVTLMLILFAGCAERVTLVDKFDGNSTLNWVLESDELGQTVIDSGQLKFTIPAAGVARYSTAEGVIGGNFVAEVETIQLAGSTNAGYGMLFRMNGSDQFYRFNITGNGYYMVEKRVAGGEWVRLTNDWQETTLLLTGLNNRNFIAVEARGSNLGFSINGFEVFSTTDSDFSSGGIALNAGTFDQGGLVVAFDNFSLETR